MTPRPGARGQRRPPTACSPPRPTGCARGRRPVGQRPRPVVRVGAGAVRRPAAPLGAARLLGGARLGRGGAPVALQRARVVGDGAARRGRLAGALDRRAGRRAGQRLRVLRRAPGAAPPQELRPRRPARAPRPRLRHGPRLLRTPPQRRQGGRSRTRPRLDRLRPPRPLRDVRRHGRAPRRRERVRHHARQRLVRPAAVADVRLRQLRETLPVGRPKAILRLEVEYADGTREAWSPTPRGARRGAAAQEQPVPGRGVRRRREQPGGTRPGFDARAGPRPSTRRRPAGGSRRRTCRPSPSAASCARWRCASRARACSSSTWARTSPAAWPCACAARPARACGCATARRSGPTARSTCSPAPSGR
jgi:hypothetical protein